MDFEPLISTEDYHLLLGAKPPEPILEPISFSDRKHLLEAIASENIQYRYINGSCEDRAHLISMILGKRGMPCGKIWNFAPARYTFLSNELFEINDPYGITQSVTWGYHVAPYLSAYSESGAVETVIIDQSFSPFSLLTLQEWLDHMNCPRSIYLCTDSASYLFNSLDGYMGYNLPIDPHFPHQIPLIPSIITGNFWNLEPGDDFVQKGLAINDLAYEIYLRSTTFNPAELHYFQALLQNIDAIIRFTLSLKPQVIRTETFVDLMDFYQKRYLYWSNRLSELMN